MAFFQWKVQESSSCLVHKCDVSTGFGICWHPKEVGFNAYEEMDFTPETEVKQAESKLASFSMALYRLPSKHVAQIRDGSSHLKRSRVKVDLLSSKDPDLNRVFPLQII